MSEEEAYKIFGEMTPDVLDYVFCLAKAYTKKDEEIERLKEEYIMLQNASDEVEEEKDKEIEILQDMDKILRNENINLKLRINKAIEYIENNKCYHECNEYCFDNMLEDVMPLLSILKGSDKE